MPDLKWRWLSVVGDRLAGYVVEHGWELEKVVRRRREQVVWLLLRRVADGWPLAVRVCYRPWRGREPNRSAVEIILRRVEDVKFAKDLLRVWGEWCTVSVARG